MKIALAQKHHGHIVESCSMKANYGSEQLYLLTAFWDAEQLKRTIHASRADVFHVHNEGDWLVRVVKEASGGRPVVFDCHDLESLRREELSPSQDEKDAFIYADGIVHVSDSHKKEGEKRHGNHKPAMVLPSYMNREYLPLARDLKALRPNWKSVCYEGGISTDQSVTVIDEIPRPDGLRRVQAQYRSFHKVVEKFASQGYLFHLFAAQSQPSDDLSYYKTGGVLNQPLPYPVMLLALRAFAFGFCGSFYPFSLMHAALPNKLFEYMSQGVVPVVYNSTETADFIMKHNVGIVLDTLDNLDRQLEKGPEIREIILEKRADFIMDDYIPELIAFYNGVDSCVPCS